MKDVVLRGVQRTNWLLVGTICLAVVLLSPALGTGYLDDDMINSLIPGILKYHQDTLLSFTWKIVKGHWDSGRILALGFALTYSIFFWIRNVILYKCYIVGCVLINVALFSYLIRKLTNNRSLSVLSAILPLVFLQFRVYHDPILSYCGLVQTIFTLVLLSLVFLCRYLESRRLSWLMMSLLAY
jgi:hypothetical protein